MGTYFVYNNSYGVVSLRERTVLFVVVFYAEVVEFGRHAILRG